jgi:EpsI family protein
MTSKLLVALLILGLNAWVYWQFASEDVIPPRTEFAAFPDDFDGWRCTGRETLEDKVIDRLLVSDYLACTFVAPAEKRSAHLYIGYHERQTRDRESGQSSAIHPPEHCLPGSGWDVIDARTVPIDIGPGGEAKRFVIAKGNSRALVYFWYHSRGRMIARNHEKILYMFLDRARYGRTDGSLVRFTIPIHQGDVESAEATFREFARSVTPRLSAFVPD